MSVMQKIAIRAKASKLACQLSFVLLITTSVVNLIVGCFPLLKHVLNLAHFAIGILVIRYAMEKAKNLLLHLDAMILLYAHVTLTPLLAKQGVIAIGISMLTFVQKILAKIIAVSALNKYAPLSMDVTGMEWNGMT